MVGRELGDKRSSTEDLVEDSFAALERDSVGTVPIGLAAVSNAAEAMALFGSIKDDEATGVVLGGDVEDEVGTDSWARTS